MALTSTSTTAFIAKTLEFDKLGLRLGNYDDIRLWLRHPVRPISIHPLTPAKPARINPASGGYTNLNQKDEELTFDIQFTEFDGSDSWQHNQYVTITPSDPNAKYVADTYKASDTWLAQKRL